MEDNAKTAGNAFLRIVILLKAPARDSKRNLIAHEMKIVIIRFFVKSKKHGLSKASVQL